MTMPPATLRLLLSTNESHPTDRPDVAVLFGRVLPSAGIACDLLTVALRDEPPARSWPGGKALLRIVPSGLRRLPGTLRQEWRLFALMRSGRYDLLVIRDKPILGLVGWFAARLARVPFAYWMSFTYPEFFLRLAREAPPGAGRLRRMLAFAKGWLGSTILYTVLLPGAAHVFAQSDRMRERLVARGLDSTRVSAVPMGIELDTLDQAMSAAGGDDIPSVDAVYIGVLDRIRQPEVMVEAALIVARSRPNFTLLLVGDVDERADKGWLQQRVRERGAENWVRFAGRVPRARALQLARRARIGLSPVPRNELFDQASPTKAVEYLALGLPVIGNDQPDQAQLIAESGGGQCVPMRAEAFAERILALLAQPALAKEMGERGRAYVLAHRTYETIGAQVTETIHHLCAA